MARDPGMIITIVSGRHIESLFSLFSSFDHADVNWSGVHGIQTRFSGSSNTLTAKTLPEIPILKDKISEIVREYPCYIVEDKEASFSLHYRKCNDKSLDLLKPIKKVLQEYVDDRRLDILYMKKVIEIKPAEINKGNTIGTINSKYGFSEDSINICIGDDVTDEDLFTANTEGINIKVGIDINTSTDAGYYLKGVSDVYWFLNMISRIRKTSKII